MDNFKLMITNLIRRFSRLKRNFLEIKYRSEYIKFVQKGDLAHYRTKLNFQFFKLNKDYSEIDKSFLYCHLGENSFLKNTNDYYYQYVLMSSKTIRKIAHSKSNKSKFSLPLSIKWINFFKDNGYDIRIYRSTILHLFLGLRIILINYLKIFLNFILPTNQSVMLNGSASNLAFVFDMNSGSLSKINEKLKKFTYSNWLFENTVIDFIHTDIPFADDKRLRYQKNPFELSCRFSYIKNLLNCIFVSTKISLRFPKLFFPLLINFYDLFLLMCSNDNRLKSKYKYFIFTNSRGEFRPIWTLDRKNHGEKSITIPYSAPEFLNSPFDGNSINHLYKNEQNLLSDLFLPAFVQNFKNQGEALFSPYFIDSNAELEPQTLKCISVFDYEAPLGHFGSNSLNEFGYHNIDVVIGFLDDILKVCNSYNLKIIHKTKRNNITVRQSDYSRYLKFLDALDPCFYQRFEADLAPIKLIKASIGTISFPISTPGFIAKDLGYKSFFYDPTCLMNPNDPVFRKVELICGKINLREHIKTNFTNF